MVSTSKTGGKETGETEVIDDEKDINAAYDDALHVLNSKAPKIEQHVDEKTKQEDYYKSFRTKCVMMLFRFTTQANLSNEVSC